MKTLRLVVTFLVLCAPAASRAADPISAMTRTNSPWQTNALLMVSVPNGAGGWVTRSYPVSMLFSNGALKATTTAGNINASGYVAFTTALSGSGTVSFTGLPGSGEFLAIDGLGDLFKTNASVSASITTNANQFGVSVTLTIKAAALVTNLIFRGLTDLNSTASRAAVFNASGNLTNASGTPDGTKFLRDDNTYATPTAAAALSTNANQFGESVPITIKAGAALTNLNIYESLGDPWNVTLPAAGGFNFGGAHSITWPSSTHFEIGELTGGNPYFSRVLNTNIFGDEQWMPDIPGSGPFVAINAVGSLRRDSLSTFANPTVGAKATLVDSGGLLKTIQGLTDDGGTNLIAAPNFTTTITAPLLQIRDTSSDDYTGTLLFELDADGMTNAHNGFVGIWNGTLAGRDATNIIHPPIFLTNGFYNQVSNRLTPAVGFFGSNWLIANSNIFAASSATNNTNTAIFIVGQRADGDTLQTMVSLDLTITAAVNNDAFRIYVAGASLQTWAAGYPRLAGQTNTSPFIGFFGYNGAHESVGDGFNVSAQMATGNAGFSAGSPVIVGAALVSGAQEFVGVIKYVGVYTGITPAQRQTKWRALARRYGFPLRQRGDSIVPEYPTLIVTEGDSISTGYNMNDSSNAWPLVVGRALGGKVRVKNFAANNEVMGNGGSGVGMLYDCTNYVRYWFAPGQETIAVLLAGRNDIDGASNGVTTATNLLEWCDVVASAGAKSVLGTILQSRWSSTYDADWKLCNQHLRTNWSQHATAFVDFRFENSIGQQSTNANWQTDGTHPTDTGGVTIANRFLSAIRRVMSGGTAQ